MAGREKRIIDPMFYIPTGMSDDAWAYDESPVVDYDDVAPDYDDIDVDSDVTIIDEGDDSTDDAPDAIDNLTVLSQTLRRAADGSTVVDIVVSVDTIPGATKYEFRVTKV